jgi:hypothetical protein
MVSARAIETTETKVFGAPAEIDGNGMVAKPVLH